MLIGCNIMFDDYGNEIIKMLVPSLVLSRKLFIFIDRI